MFKTILNHNVIKISVVRSFSSTPSAYNQSHSKVLIVGGGTGGCSMSSRFVRYLGKNKVTVIEPSSVHYYQPLFTLVGGGLKKARQAVRKEANVLPKGAEWIQDCVAKFDPKNNSVTTSRGKTITYDILIVAVGLETHYDQVPGLLEAVEKYDNVGSIYSPKYAEKAFKAIEKFEKGDAIYTYPSTAVKCPGAPQKICYLQEHYLRKVGKRSKANVTYATTLPVIFGVKKYADALWKVVKQRNINVNLRTNLIEVKPDKNEAVFRNMDNPKETFTMQYSMLHAVPPMATPLPLKENKCLTNAMGFLTVNKCTMQHTKYPNIFGIGDCTDSPNSKTAAAISAQSIVLFHNIKAVLEGKPIVNHYDGYASCPLVTAPGKCILAEFDYKLTPLETFPISQDRELYIMYFLKAQMMPWLYWNLLVTGYWNGPAVMRKFLHLGFK